MARARKETLKKRPFHNWRDETVHFSRGFFRAFLALERKVLAVVLSFVIVLSYAQSFIAFESHVINVAATVAQIDPPVISPPGGEYSGTVSVTIDDSDPDATHIFYTLTPGLDPSAADDPVCGDFLGGPKPIGPFDITEDMVVKAIACDGAQVGAHASLIAAEVYDITDPFGSVSGHKYHDMDKSGTLSDGDFPLEGWRINLMQNNGLIATTVTDDNGYYRFSGIVPGLYNILEESRAGWQAITSGNVGVNVDANEALVVDFFNYDTGFACVPQDISFPANLAVQAAGNTSGNDDVDIASNVTINGDVRSNDEIEIIGGGSNRTINGNAAVVNTIDAGIVVTGTTTTGAPAVPLPDAMISTWQARAQDGGTVNGSFTFPNNTAGLVMGPSEIMGNVTFGSSNGLTVKGPLYIHGDLTIGSNTTITQDAGFGNQFVAIIVDGEINIDSNISFNGSGANGTFLLVSTRAAIGGNDAAIRTSSNNSDLGDVVLYASNGDIHIESNRTLLAAFAVHGTGNDSDDNGAIRLDSNVTVNYRALPTKISCGPRQPYETTSHILINEFMPNPTGSDQGSAGLPLDGEWVELFNPTAGSVDVAGYILYDEVNTHALPITTANTDTGGTTIPSLGRLVVYREGDGDFELDNAGGDTVRLFSADIGSGGVLVDSHTYTRSAPENKSFARIPDGATNWIDPDATPGDSNLFFFEPLAGPGLEPFNPPELPPLVITNQKPVVLGITSDNSSFEPKTTSEEASVNQLTDEPTIEESAPAEPAPNSGETLDSALSDETQSLDHPPADSSLTPEPAPSEELAPSEEPAPVDELAPTVITPDETVPAEESAPDQNTVTEEPPPAIEPPPAAEPAPAETAPS